MMRIYKLTTGDEVHRYNRNVVVEFKGKRAVLSTSPFNGGYMENLQCVFNHDGNVRAGVPCKMKAPTYEEHMKIIAREIGLDPENCAGLSTAANMENVSIKTDSFDDFSVTAIVTGGIEVNGGRVGDIASFHEKQGKALCLKEGTINIILVVNANLPAPTMVRALVTCTEAKTAAIEELMLPSKYSRGIATGSGTDGTIIVCNKESKVKLTNAGKHSKLGEYIGKTVKKAVKEALYLQTGVCPEVQYSMLRRMGRFGINSELLWEKYNSLYETHLKGKNKLTVLEFMHNLDTFDKNSKFVLASSIYAHLIDEFDWDILKSEDIVYECSKLLKNLREDFIEEKSSEKAHEIINYSDLNKEEVIETLIDSFQGTIAFITGSEKYV
ncbi:adenosylcobinamide amidohydrolase [Haloimpatiens sp. FM7315]|uniref:adenosylcobinamide amidohydrolase n=1 Tax=Haloimpatiens sp. FM7315 TaxID=3298609 RepID=UPI0035A2DF5E